MGSQGRDFFFSSVGDNSEVVRHHAAKWPSKAERQAGDRPGHTDFSESLIWDRDDIPSLQQLLSGGSGALCWRGGIILIATLRLSVKETREGKGM